MISRSQSSKHLALIPARGNSKELPKKNIKKLQSKPMIEYTIRAAQESGCFDQVVLSTEDFEIASIAESLGLEIPFMRPTHLAKDTTSLIDVVSNVLDFFDAQGTIFETLTLLQPTSPLRNAYDIKEAMQLFNEKKADSIISVCESDTSPYWMNVLPDDLNMANFLDQKFMNKRRQELQKYYVLNGAIYIVRTSLFKETKSFYYQKTFAYVMPKIRSVDVDSEIDFYTCEAILNNLSK